MTKFENIKSCDRSIGQSYVSCEIYSNSLGKKTTKFRECKVAVLVRKRGFAETFALVLYVFVPPMKLAHRVQNDCKGHEGRHESKN